MDLQDDVNKKAEAGIEKVIAYTMQLAELTEEMFKKSLAGASVSFTRDRYSTSSVAEMTKSGRNIEVLDTGMLPNVAKRFYNAAKKDGLAFSMLKDSSSTPPTYSLCFYEKDRALIKKTVSNFLANEAKQIKKQSVIRKLKVMGEKAKELNDERKAERSQPERSR